MDFVRPLATVVPSLDGAALTVLAGADAWFTLSDVVHLADEGSPAGMRKVLLRLTSTGLVEHREVGRVGQWRLNREHLAAGPVISLVHSRRELVERLRRHVAGWATPPRVGAIFGSVARGQARLDSDLDLLLVVDSPSDVEDEVADLERQATLWTGNTANALVRPVGRLLGTDSEAFRWTLASSHLLFFGERRDLRDLLEARLRV